MADGGLSVAMTKLAIFAVLSAFVVLVGAAGYGTWGLTVASKSWDELGVSERVEFVTVVITIGATRGHSWACTLPSNRNDYQIAIGVMR